MFYIYCQHMRHLCPIHPYQASLKSYQALLIYFLKDLATFANASVFFVNACFIIFT